MCRIKMGTSLVLLELTWVGCVNLLETSEALNLARKGLVLSDCGGTSTAT